MILSRDNLIPGWLNPPLGWLGVPPRRQVRDSIRPSGHNKKKLFYENSYHHDVLVKDLQFLVQEQNNPLAVQLTAPGNQSKVRGDQDPEGRFRYYRPQRPAAFDRPRKFHAKSGRPYEPAFSRKREQ